MAGILVDLSSMHGRAVRPYHLSLGAVPAAINSRTRPVAVTVADVRDTATRQPSTTTVATTMSRAEPQLSDEHPPLLQSWLYGEAYADGFSLLLRRRSLYRFEMSRFVSCRSMRSDDIGVRYAVSVHRGWGCAPRARCHYGILRARLGLAARVYGPFYGTSPLRGVLKSAVGIYTYLISSHFLQPSRKRFRARRATSV